jgi:hypothetical protein
MHEPSNLLSTLLWEPRNSHCLIYLLFPYLFTFPNPLSDSRSMITVRYSKIQCNFLQSFCDLHFISSHTLFLRIQEDFLTVLITIWYRCGPNLLINLQLFICVCPPVTWYKWTVPQFPRPKLPTDRHIHKINTIFLFFLLSVLRKVP